MALTNPPAYQSLNYPNAGYGGFGLKTAGLETDPYPIPDPSDPNSRFSVGSPGTPNPALAVNPGLPAAKPFNAGAIANSPVDVNPMMAGPSGASEQSAGPSGVSEQTAPTDDFNAEAIANANPDWSEGGEYPETDLSPGQRTISPYDDGPSNMTNNLNAAGDVTMAAGAIPGPQMPYVAAAGLALKGAGTVSGIYGKYKDRQEAKDRYNGTLAQWRQAESERKADKRREERRQERQESYFAADYAKDTTDYFANAYTGQRTPGGQ